MVSGLDLGLGFVWVCLGVWWFGYFVRLVVCNCWFVGCGVGDCFLWYLCCLQIYVFLYIVTVWSIWCYV